MSAKCLVYGDLTDEALAAKIEELRGAYETAISGGVATVIAGHGRRMEYTRANADGLMSLLKLAVREQERRAGKLMTGGMPIYFPSRDGGYLGG